MLLCDLPIKWLLWVIRVYEKVLAMWVAINKFIFEKLPFNTNVVLLKAIMFMVEIAVSRERM